ncbi:MAG: hypothetical protein BroJett030_32440 [Alphaproteobacteria bacterium]|nr:MAG: hypothetical protein BroJett030_32440 [Alphaproteobacteria bacterium]
MSELSEVTRVGAVTVTADGMVEVRRDTFIMRGPEIVAGPRYHRHVLAPGDDLANEAAHVRRIAEAAWTPDVVAAHRARAEVDERAAARAGAIT